MESSPETLLVRQHERLTCSLRAQASVAPQCGTQVRLARTLGDGSRTINATVIDCSPGGLGINSGVFFPRSSLIHVRVSCGEGDQAESVFEETLRVQRVTMVGSDPTYYLGTSFADSPRAESLERLMAAARRASASGQPLKGAGGA
ncbi:MAG: hypothetical protein JNK58_00640 [Phycisphaerae bacterium]|nr:hypothetical protein [Phycisphaerae bacterium]